MTINSFTYHGRFAPTPSGDLHFGSLLAAMASYLDCRSHQGIWSVRIDDLDNYRIDKTSISHILSTLENYGFTWDTAVYYQSQQLDYYHHLLANIMPMTYYCQCTRKQLLPIQKRNTYGETVYPGICQNKGLTKKTENTALRLHILQPQQTLQDVFHGKLDIDLEKKSGDFIIQRKDGLFAYQWACALDDIQQGITHIIRGEDLLLSSARQQYIHQCLQHPFLQYGHIPLAMDQQGYKLSKQHHAPALSSSLENILPTLIRAYQQLGQVLEKNISFTSYDEFWHYAITHWQRKRIPHITLAV